MTTRFKLQVECLNDAMQTPEQLADVLARVADDVREIACKDDEYSIIRDENGNTVGEWSITDDEPLPAIPAKKFVKDGYAESIIIDPADYDGLEVHGVRDIALNPCDETICEVDDENPQFFSVYAHCILGGVECIGDFTSWIDALKYGNEIGEKHGWKCLNYYKTDAERAELALAREHDEPGEVTVQVELPPLWMREFGTDYDVSPVIDALVEKGILFDVSWHNNTCPSFDDRGGEVVHPDGTTNNDGTRVLWVDHPDREHREVPDQMERYAVQIMDEDYQFKRCLYEGNSLLMALGIMLGTRDQCDWLFANFVLSTTARIADELEGRKLGFKAESYHTGGGIFVTQITTPEGYVFDFGDCCEFWGADCYGSTDDYETMDRLKDELWIEVPSGVTDEIRIVDGFLKAYDAWKTVAHTEYA